MTIMHLVVAEWDGKKPPNRFYQRRSRMGINVRGDDPKKKKSILERRMTFVEETDDGKFMKSMNDLGGGAVIVQEGTVLCESYSLARQYAALSMEEGARLVLGPLSVNIDESSLFTLEQGDIDSLSRLHSVHGKKGRPTGDKHDFVVCCMEEAKSYIVPDVRDVTNCPNCHGANIRRRMGNAIPSFQPYPRKKVVDPFDLFGYWVATRFTQGVYETPKTDIMGKKPPKLEDTVITFEKEHDLMNLIQGSQEFMALIGKLSPQTGLDLLDGAFCSRNFTPKNHRQKLRLSIITECLSQGADPKKVQMNEKPKTLDVIDCAAVVGSQSVVSIYMLHCN